MKLRLLYLAAGNPLTPSRGMEMVIREHIHELLKIDAITLHGVVVLPGAIGSLERCPNSPWPNFKFFMGDLQNEVRASERIQNKLITVLSGKLLDHYAFRSREARQHLRREIETEYDIILVDSLIPLCNVDIRTIKKRSSKMIFIAHTVSANAILDGGRLKRGFTRKIYHGIQALQSLLLESTVIKISVVSVFLSEWDRRFFDRKRRLRTISLCPTFGASRLESPSGNIFKNEIREVIFVGSPTFSPNKFAIDWIINKLAVELFEVDPTISIVLVGKGTEEYSGRAPGNVVGRGFVSDQDLTALLQGCLALLSPVIHGSGIKIKILEAFAAGCPVLATENSLRGFEFMEIEPKIDLSCPTSVVHEVVSLANDENLRNERRRKIEESWKKYVGFRDGQLKNVISDVINSLSSK
jgi:glycosyltransferase involved in cell wall biosynthesis